jgi:hypothetical protein
MKNSEAVFRVNPKTVWVEYKFSLSLLKANAFYSRFANSYSSSQSRQSEFRFSAILRVAAFLIS